MVEIDQFKYYTRCKICGNMFSRSREAEKHIPQHYGFLTNLWIVLTGKASKKIEENLHMVKIEEYKTKP